MGERRRIIVGVTGTTGVEMSYELLLALRAGGGRHLRGAS